MRAIDFFVTMVRCGGATPASDPPKTTSDARPEVHDAPPEMNPMIDLINKEDYAGAAGFLAEHKDICLASKQCSHNARVLYLNWTVGYQNTGDWAGARKVLQDCVAA